MAESISRQVYAGFAGDHEGINIVALPDIFSSEDSQNVRFDKFGQIRKINGYAAQNSAYTTDTGASATKVVGLAPYRTFASGTTTRRVIAVFDDATNEYEIAVSTDSAATFTFLKDLGSGSVGKIPDFAQFGNTIYITDGVSVPQQYDGSSIANVASSTRSPTPTLTSSGTGPCSGTYQCKILSMIGDARQIGSVTSSEVQLNSANGAVSWTADANTNVTGYELYFTTGTGNQFYFSGYVNGRTTVAYTHSIPDTNLLQNRVLDEHGDAPPTGTRYVEPHKQRMWWAGTNANPRRAYYSSPGDADSVGAFNYIQFDDATSGSDELKGMTGNFNDMMVAWQEYSVWRVTGSGELINDLVDWNRERTNASVGTVTHRSVVRVPAGAVYTSPTGESSRTSQVTLAYYTPFNRIHMFDGDIDVEIGSPKNDFLNSVQFQYRHLIWAEHDSENYEITWYVPHGTSQTIVNKGVTWNYRYGTWSEITQAPFGHGCAIEGANDAQLLLAGSASTATGGLVYANKSGTSYNGTGNNITAQWWTKPLLGTGDAGQVPYASKRWRRLYPITAALSSSQNLSIAWYTDWSNASATAYASATVDMNISNATHEQNKVLLKNTSGDYPISKAIRLRFYDAADDAAWGLAGFTLEYQLLLGEKGR